MNLKSTITSIVAAATLTAAGVALAQTGAPANAVPPSSTAGSGCTATANAMKGGNMGGSPSKNIDCGPTAATTTMGATTATPATVATPAPMATDTTTKSSTASMAPATTDTTAADTTSKPARSTRMARADRG